MSSTTPTTNLIDNIFINLSTGTTSWLSTAIRRTSTVLTSYGTSSNNNFVYCGTPSATNAIYYDGTNTDQTLAAFKARVTPRESASISETVSTTPGVFFQSFTGPASGTSTTFLHLVNGLATQIESGGIPITGISDDFDGPVLMAGLSFSAAGTNTVPFRTMSPFCHRNQSQRHRVPLPPIDRHSLGCEEI